MLEVLLTRDFLEVNVTFPHPRRAKMLFTAEKSPFSNRSIQFGLGTRQSDTGLSSRVVEQQVRSV